ncbi:MAG: hypothetical protein V4819_16395 [Verrucomicrobiota bacterium]
MKSPVSRSSSSGWLATLQTALLLVVACACPGLLLGSETVGFEDIPQKPLGDTFVPYNYGGLIWDNAACQDATKASVQPNGYYGGSGIVAVTAFARPMIISLGDGNVFDVHDTLAGAAWNNGLQVTFLGTYPDQTTISKTVAANTSGASSITLNFEGITKLTISAQGGTQAYPNYTSATHCYIDNFRYTIHNLPPSIGNPGIQLLAANSEPVSVLFAIYDTQTPPENLQVSFTTSNPKLCSLALSGTGAIRTLEMTPKIGQTGTSLVALTVSDGVLSSTVNFVISIENTRPAISRISNQYIKMNSSTGSLPVTITDQETPPADLLFPSKIQSSDTALVPLSSISIGGSGADRTVTVTPLPGKSGSSIITLTVSDGQYAESKSFMVTVLKPDLVANSLAWDPETGGLLFKATVVGTAPQTSAKAYWAKGTAASPEFLSPDRPIYTYDISSGSSGAVVIHIPGNILRNAPKDTTRVVVVLDAEGGVSEEDEDNNSTTVADVKINYADGQPVHRLSDLTVSVIKEALRFAGQHKGWITSTYRSEERQAAVMFKVLDGEVEENMGKVKSTVQYSRRLYGDKGGPVIDAYVEAKKDYPKKLTKKQKENRRKEIVTKMTEAIRQAKKDYPGAFPHTSESSKLQVIDISARRISNHTLFEEAIMTSTDPRIARHFSPLTDPKDIAFHLEIPQTTSKSQNLLLAQTATNANFSSHLKRYRADGALSIFDEGQPLVSWNKVAHPSRNDLISNDKIRKLTMIDPAGGKKYRAIVVSKAPQSAEQHQIVEVSSNLVDWSSGRKHTTIVRDDDRFLMVRDNTPITLGTKRYIRLKMPQR